MSQKNKDLIVQFYSSLQILNHEGMQKAYHPDASFSDPVFGELSCEQVKAMWQMLLTSGQDLQVAFSNVQATDTDGSCRWEAWYTFSKTGRMVHNVVLSKFKFQDNLIFRQDDKFSLWRWSRYALGWPGIFLGWSPWIQNEIKEKARKSLDKFMKIDTRQS